jgi:oligosaccharide translocation protein RFT1
MPAGVALAQTAYLVGLQLFSKPLTFALNQILLRYTRIDQFGVAAVQLELLLSTILFLSREAVRSTLCRVDLSDDKTITNTKTDKARQLLRRRWRQFLNFSWDPLLLGLPITTLLLTWLLLFHHSTTTTATHQTDTIATGVVINYALAALLELAVEPLYSLCIGMSLQRVRVIVEAVAMFSKCSISAGLLISGSLDTVWAFSVAQLVYSVVLLLGYTAAWKRVIKTTGAFEWRLDRFPSCFHIHYRRQC